MTFFEKCKEKLTSKKNKKLHSSVTRKKVNSKEYEDVRNV